MKKRWIAFLLVILTLAFFTGMAGFAEEGDIQPVISEDVPDTPPATDPPVVPPTAAPTEAPPTVPPTAPPTEPIITVPPTQAPSAAPTVPTIIKDPGAEVVQSGEGCLFIAKADNYTGINWYFTKNGQIVYAADAANKFPGLKVAGDGTEFFSLESVPDSLDGWNVGAVFSNAVGQQGTATCTITVIKSAKPTPTAAPSPTPTIAPTPTPRPEVTLPPTMQPSAAPDTAVPTASPDPEETGRNGFPFGLLLAVLLIVAFMVTAAILFVFTRRKTERNDKAGKTGASRSRQSAYEDFDDDDDDPDDDDINGNSRKAYKGKH